MREASSSHRVRENALTIVVRDLSEDLLVGGRRIILKLIL